MLSMMAKINKKWCVISFKQCLQFLVGPEIVKNLYSTFINILEYYSTFTFHKTFGNTGSGKFTTIKLIIT